MNSKPPQQIAIIGAGWAGLAAAVELARHGHQVSIFESSPQLGGRARATEWNGMMLDNGQHLMIGAYQQMLELLGYMQADIDSLFRRLPHRMLMMDAATSSVAFDLELPTFPAPFHLLFGIFKTPSLSFREKIRVLIRFNSLLNRPMQTDINVTDWLASAGLPEAYVENVLKPVCLAALTTHPHNASARAFQTVLQQTFNGPAEFTDLLIPTTNLGEVFPAHARAFIEQHDGKVYTRCKLHGLQTEDKRVSSIDIDNEQKQFDQVILATPPRITAKLLESIPACSDAIDKIHQLQYEPVATLYLQFDQPVSLPFPMTGIVNGTAEWVFERSISGHANVLAIVISASGSHTQLSHDDLVDVVANDLRSFIPDLPEIIDSQLISEKRATFQCHPDVDHFRPGIETPLSNLWLCGDYVYIEENNQPGLPSTLEGALRSGVKCAQAIIHSSAS